MRHSLTLLFLLAVSIVLSQEMEPRPLIPFLEPSAELFSAIELGNGCRLAKNSNGDDVLTFEGSKWTLFDFVTCDEIKSAFWLDMNGDGKEDLILETSWSSGHSSFTGGVFEEFKYTTIVDVHHGWFLFSFDYYIESNTWTNEVEFDEDEGPIIEGSESYYDLSDYQPFYTKGRVYFFKIKEELSDEDESWEGENVYMYVWNGQAFEEEHALSSLREND